MAYSENIAQRIRNSLEHLANVEEKKMFGSLAFMVNGKMCLTAGPKRMMCRIDPKLHEQEVRKIGCSTVVMRGRNYKGYIHVQEENLKQENDFEHWIELALDFNEQLTSKGK
ncbi:TfoX/Sxy family protein [Mesonia sp. HuA40]|uniref:TfoX/Sxy family protein n=1 Tax=Mesonia sp. HuA40 TaxID=2602761 RepID=UPI0011C8B2F9|nr:TfoX/Sxy family protein [Mesonia sp. HuA40]TXK74837.1 TfoX/Sxy family protein [Mesonia sp. HuA40]